MIDGPLVRKYSVHTIPIEIEVPYRSFLHIKNPGPHEIFINGDQQNGYPMKRDAQISLLKPKPAGYKFTVCTWTSSQEVFVIFERAD